MQMFVRGVKIRKLGDTRSLLLDWWKLLMHSSLDGVMTYYSEDS